MENHTREQCRLVSVPLGTAAHEYPNGIVGLLQDQGGNSEDSGMDDDQNPSISDCESGISGGKSDKSQLFGDGFVKLDEDDRMQETITQRFMFGLGPFGEHTSVVAIHRNSCSGFTGQARLQSFQIFCRAMENKCGNGDGNIKYAWYGASKDEIQKIISHGFGHCGEEQPQNIGLYGKGIYLSPHHSPTESVKSSTVDRDGLRHMLLCRVILGKMEAVSQGSEQFHPSSEEFDSGVDNLLAPKKYIVWTTHMNTHIFPEYVISFRVENSFKGCPRIHDRCKKPSSPWMPFASLISVLSKFVPPRAIALLSQYHTDYKEKKMSRHELIQRVRQIAGDKLLIAVIKSFRDKQFFLQSTDIWANNTPMARASFGGKRSNGAAGIKK